jgi:hypothetical protein
MLQNFAANDYVEFLCIRMSLFVLNDDCEPSSVALT